MDTLQKPFFLVLLTSSLIAGALACNENSGSSDSPPFVPPQSFRLVDVASKAFFDLPQAVFTVSLTNPDPTGITLTVVLEDTFSSGEKLVLTQGVGGPPIDQCEISAEFQECIVAIEAAPLAAGGCHPITLTTGDLGTVVEVSVTTAGPPPPENPCLPELSGNLR